MQTPILNRTKIFFNSKGLPENRRRNNSTTFHKASIALEEKQHNAFTRKQQTIIPMHMDARILHKTLRNELQPNTKSIVPHD